MSIKKPSDTIGNRTRDLPTCGVVPQPTALPRAPTRCILVLICRTLDGNTFQRIQLDCRIISRLQRSETHQGCLAPSTADFAHFSSVCGLVRKVSRRLPCLALVVIEGRVNLEFCVQGVVNSVNQCSILIYSVQLATTSMLPVGENLPAFTQPFPRLNVLLSGGASVRYSCMQKDAN